MKVIAVYHIKGGVGKTATAVNLSYLASRSDGRTLICDLDPQSSATYYFRVKPKIKAGVKSLLRGGKRIDRSIKGTDYENLDLLPGDFSYRNFDVGLSGTKNPKDRLRKVLEPFSEDYDLVFLDCPPNINIVAENVFSAADEIIVPVVPTTLSARTFETLLNFLAKNEYGTQKVLAFYSMVEMRKTLHRSTMERMSREYRGILKNYIPYMSDIERMGLSRQPVPAVSPASPAFLKYRALWNELRALIFAFG